MKLLLMMACTFLASGSFRSASKTREVTVCGNGQTAVAINLNRGKAATAQKNQNGVTATQSSTGGPPKIKIGKGVVQGPTVPFAPGANQQGLYKVITVRAALSRFFGVLFEA